MPDEDVTRHLGFALSCGPAPGVLSNRSSLVAKYRLGFRHLPEKRLPVYVATGGSLRKKGFATMTRPKPVVADDRPLARARRNPFHRCISALRDHSQAESADCSPEGQIGLVMWTDCNQPGSLSA